LNGLDGQGFSRFEGNGCLNIHANSLTKTKSILPDLAKMRV
jgi:hypothetical protein